MDKKEKLLKAIALVRENKWEKAHNLVQEYEGDYAFDCIHALLHRQEGDVFNARWWYRNIGKEMPDLPIHEELKLLERELIKP